MNFLLDKIQPLKLYQTKTIYIKLIYISSVILGSMKLTTKTRYGARLLSTWLNVRVRAPSEMSEISLRQDISINILRQIIRPLKKAKFVKSIRGPKGGHLLAKKPGDITLGVLHDCLKVSPNSLIVSAT